MDPIELTLNEVDKAIGRYLFHEKGIPSGTIYVADFHVVETPDSGHELKKIVVRFPQSGGDA